MSNNAQIILPGLPTSGGLIAGPVFIYRGEGEIRVPEYKLEKCDVDGEVSRLRRAINATRRDLENLISVLRERTGKSNVGVFEGHLMIMEDEVFAGEMEAGITLNLFNAEASVRKIMDGARNRFQQMNDPYFRERARDFDDLERRLLGHLTGTKTTLHFELKSPAIIVADDLTPSETVLFPRELVLGFATNGGSTTSHVSLLARALAIPSVCALGDITSRVVPGETILLDGYAGTVTVNPDKETLEEFSRLAALHKKSAVTVSDVTPGELKDGSKIKISVNAHPGLLVPEMIDSGAEGIGLYRSEYLWIGRELEPTEDEQFKAYLGAVEFASGFSGDKTVTIRTLDIGGDKTMLGSQQKEANPFLGNRSIRYLLSSKDIMKKQLRAILRASAHGKIKIMHPMISCVEELHESKKVFDEVRKSLDAEGIAYDRDICVGAMVEVPSAALIAEDLAEHVDFFSIGTNDLVQYTMAADRGNDSVAYLYQPLNLAIIKLVSMTVAAAKKKGIPVSVCGESASDPVAGVLWAALGVDTLSISPNYVAMMANVLSRLSRAELDEFAKVPFSLPSGSTAAQVYDACREWLECRISDFSSIIRLG
jgi:phosphotransferase system enzyme I (PtsI)